ncbi:MAG: hypothetical protein ACLFNU_01075 [Bacteroidales bacterium]
MRFFSNNSRLSYGILLVLLIISVSGVFFSLQNQLAQYQTKIPVLAIILLVASAAIGILFFQIIITAINASNSNKQQLEQLKKSIQENQKKQDTKNGEKKKDSTKQEINYKAEAEKLIPSDDFEDLEVFTEKMLSNIAKEHDIVQGVFFKKEPNNSEFSFLASYAFFSEETPKNFAEGETLPGQVAKNKTTLNLSDVPDDYITIVSGLGEGSPNHLLLVPFLNSSNECEGVLELASFKPFEKDNVKVFEALGQFFTEHLLTIGNSTKE